MSVGTRSTVLEDYRARKREAISNAKGDAVCGHCGCELVDAIEGWPCESCKSRRCDFCWDTDAVCVDAP